MLLFSKNVENQALFVDFILTMNCICSYILFSIFTRNSVTYKAQTYVSMYVYPYPNQNTHGVKNVAAKNLKRPC